MSDPFYKAFEDQHRGSRTMVKSQLQVYLPFVHAIGVQYPSASALDLKCGRGEWLEILAEAGFDARGVDSEQVTVEVCRQRGLNVRQAEALAALAQCADASQVLVSGFQVAEQLPFDDLQKLVKEVLRVLKPGGLLILETPDPENIMVGTSYFHLDPRRVKPLPPLLLSYLAKYHGFFKTKIIQCGKPSKNDEFSAVSLLGVLSALSAQNLNYALIAQKAGADGNLLFDGENEASSRVHELKDLAFAFDQRIEQRIGALSQKLFAVEKALASIHGSYLWKMTAPIRWVVHQSAHLREHGVRDRLWAFVKKSSGPCGENSL
jgi:O-antigen chain-terminating methyltransferase